MKAGADLALLCTDIQSSDWPGRSMAGLLLVETPSPRWFSLFSTKETDRKFQSQGITKECFCNLAHAACNSDKAGDNDMDLLPPNTDTLTP